MVGLDHVRQLVNQNIVQHEQRRGAQPIRDADGPAIGRAAAEPLALVHDKAHLLPAQLAPKVALVQEAGALLQETVLLARRPLGEGALCLGDQNVGRAQNLRLAAMPRGAEL